MYIMTKVIIRMENIKTTILEGTYYHKEIHLLNIRQERTRIGEWIMNQVIVIVIKTMIINHKDRMDYQLDPLQIGHHMVRLIAMIIE